MAADLRHGELGLRPSSLVLNLLLGELLDLGARHLLLRLQKGVALLLCLEVLVVCSDYRSSQPIEGGGCIVYAVHSMVLLGHIARIEPG